nr:phenylalanine--tRNA ligase, chloroplastic/mitochondrial [Tanacetum cinerariifolium]
MLISLSLVTSIEETPLIQLIIQYFIRWKELRVFNPCDWNASGMDGTLYAAQELKTCLEGLARHLFGTID